MDVTSRMCAPVRMLNCPCIERKKKHFYFLSETYNTKQNTEKMLGAREKIPKKRVAAQMAVVQLDGGLGR